MVALKVKSSIGITIAFVLEPHIQTFYAITAKQLLKLLDFNRCGE